MKKWRCRIRMMEHVSWADIFDILGCNNLEMKILFVLPKLMLVKYRPQKRN
jgi:hypothetical protein